MHMLAASLFVDFTVSVEWTDKSNSGMCFPWPRHLAVLAWHLGQKRKRPAATREPLQGGIQRALRILQALALPYRKPYQKPYRKILNIISLFDFTTKIAQFTITR